MHTSLTLLLFLSPFPFSTPSANREYKRTLVFCNTVKSCRAAEFALREVDVAALSYHGEVPSGERAKNLERFKAGEAEYLVSFCMLRFVLSIGSKGRSEGGRGVSGMNSATTAGNGSTSFFSCVILGLLAPDPSRVKMVFD